VVFKNGLMYFVYILRSLKSEKYYIGYTSDLEKRLTYHNTGKNISTKNGAPWSLVYSEKFTDKASAWKREHQIKSFKSGNAFKKLLEI